MPADIFPHAVVERAQERKTGPFPAILGKGPWPKL